MHRIRILLADDHALIRECLASILERYEDVEVVGHVENGADALRRAAELLPDVVVMDISMKGVNGIEATRSIVRELPSIKVLMLSMHAESRYVVESIKAGALGFVVKSCIASELIEGVRSEARNKPYFSPQLRPIYDDELQKGSGAPVGMASLTRREREILVMLAGGKGYSEIGTLLRISSKTVETHRAKIMKKLNLKNMAQLAKYAVREGLLPLE